MTANEESGVTFEIPDFEEKKTPIFEEIPNLDIDDLEPLPLEVEKTPEIPVIQKKIEQKKAPEVKIEEPASIDYSKVSEFGEYPSEPKPVLSKKPEKIPTVSEKPFKSPSKKGLWARIVDKIPVDKDGKLALKSKTQPVEITVPLKKSKIKLEVINTPKNEEFIPIDASEEINLDSLIDMDELFEDSPAVEVQVPVKAVEPVPVKVLAPVQTTAPKRSMMRIIEEPIDQPDPEPETAVSPEIQKLLEKIKAPVPAKPVAAEEKPKVPPADREIKKLFRDVLTKRKAPVEQEVEEEALPAKRSYVERKFSPIIAPLIEQTPPVSGIDFDDSETVLPDPLVEAIRRKPLPPVKMARKETFWGRIKKTKIATMVSHKQKERKRTKETGMTARQRIKRYNAIHEGGYGMEGFDDKGTKTQ